MKKTSLLAVLTLAICGIACNSTKRSLGIGEPSRREEFDRKVRCEKYASQVRAEWKDEQRDTLVTQKLTIERLFYSPQRNSCVCVVQDKILVESNHPSFMDHVFMFDVLTKESIWSKDYSDTPIGAETSPASI